MDYIHRMTRRAFVKVSAVGTAIMFSGIGVAACRQLGGGESRPVKIGFITTLTGLEAILGEVQLNCAQLALEEVNAAGGLLGKPAEIIVEDNATDPKLSIEKANKLMKQDQVDVIMGLITSAERNATVSVTSPAKQLLIYPTYYEGGHCDRYLVCTGQVPNQSVDPFVPWLIKNVGKTFYIAGSDYVWPRKTAEAVRAAVEANGGRVLGEEFFPFGTTDFASALNRIKSANPDIAWTMFAGNDAVAFGKQYRAFDMKPTVATNGLDEIFAQAVGPEADGIISNQSYFMTLDTPENREFLRKYQEKHGADARVDSIGEATYCAMHLYALAVNEAGSAEPEKVLEALPKVSFQAPEGKVNIDAATQHMVTNSIIGRARADGMFEIIEHFGQVPPKPGCTVKG